VVRLAESGFFIFIDGKLYICVYIYRVYSAYYRRIRLMFAVYVALSDGKLNFSTLEWLLKLLSTLNLICAVKATVFLKGRFLFYGNPFPCKNAVLTAN
jgi:hypothetical protein